MGDYTYDAMFKCRSIQVFINLSMLNISGEKLNIYAIHGKVSCLNVAANTWVIILVFMMQCLNEDLYKYSFIFLC